MKNCRTSTVASDKNSNGVRQTMQFIDEMWDDILQRCDEAGLCFSSSGDCCSTNVADEMLGIIYRTFATEMRLPKDEDGYPYMPEYEDDEYLFYTLKLFGHCSSDESLKENSVHYCKKMDAINILLNSYCRQSTK